jgi:hypothetical protein
MIGAAFSSSSLLQDTENSKIPASSNAVKINAGFVFFMGFVFGWFVSR